MMTMQIERQAALEVEVAFFSSSIVVVRLCGEIDADQVDDLARHLELAVTQNPRFVILDLARVNYLSPESLGCLDEFRRERCWQGSEVWLTSLQPAVWLALHAARLDARFTVRASVADALTS
jgi:anti-anti-sigma factor